MTKTDNKNLAKIVKAESSTQDIYFKTENISSLFSSVNFASRGLLNKHCIYAMNVTLLPRIAWNVFVTSN